MMAARPLIVFDVNETLLDLGTIEPTFERIFGDKNAMRLWFASLILYSVALTVADSYVPFTDIGSAVMTGTCMLYARGSFRMQSATVSSNVRGRSQSATAILQ
jgi:hypothetical protein